MPENPETIRLDRVRKLAITMSALCWISLLAFLICSESFHRFCYEVVRLSAKI